MRVRLKGLNKVRKQLADGSTVTYYYAWKGGPRLPGKPGSSEFLDAYNQIISEKSKQPEGVLLSILRNYQESQKFKDLAVDLSQNCSAPLFAYYALKEKRHGNTTYNRI